MFEQKVYADSHKHSTRFSHSYAEFLFGYTENTHIIRALLAHRKENLLWINNLHLKSTFLLSYFLRKYSGLVTLSGGSSGVTHSRDQDQPFLPLPQ